VTEFQATVGLIALLGILLALARMIQIDMQRRKDWHRFMEYAAPLMAQFEQSLHVLTATLPSATEAMHGLSEAMQKMKGAFEAATLDERGNSQSRGKIGPIRMNVVEPEKED